MKANNKPHIEKKIGLHPRNRHINRYDFTELMKTYPKLSSFVSKNKFDDESIDFANPEAVIALNSALLKYFYNINFWDIPKNYLCPPIPGRADYIHQVADLLASKYKNSIPTGKKIKILDIGVGANCVYPLIGKSEYDWSFVGSDIDPIAIASAKKIVSENKLEDSIEIRLQAEKNHIFKGIIFENESFDICISNPPFHTSIDEALAGNERKTKNLSRQKTKSTSNSLNFGGVGNELWCEGGEIAFAQKMIQESVHYKNQCSWFSTLVSKYTSLPSIYEELKKHNIVEFKTIDMAQGQKKSRIIAWTFYKQS